MMRLISQQSSQYTQKGKSNGDKLHNINFSQLNKVNKHTRIRLNVNNIYRSFGTNAHVRILIERINMCQ